MNWLNVGEYDWSVNTLKEYSGYVSQKDKQYISLNQGLIIGVLTVIEGNIFRNFCTL